MSKQETLTPKHTTEAVLLCCYLTPLALQWHNPLKSVTLFLPRAVAVQGAQEECHKPHIRQGQIQFLLYMKQANREKLLDKAHSKSVTLGTALLWTATSRRVSSHASRRHTCHPACICACMGKRDSALLAKIKCLRKDFDGEGNDLMGHLTWKKWENRNSDTCGGKRLIGAVRMASLA